MSSQLSMEPVNRKKKYLSYELKSVLRKKYGGSVNIQHMDLSDVSYIKALIDVGIDGAQELLEYLEKYEEIVLNEEY